jgi:multiple sugar transport system permease protein
MASVSAPVARRRISPNTLRNVLLGLLFCSPWLIGLLAFRAYPIAMAFWYSFTDYHGMMEPQFVGLENYGILFTNAEIRDAALNTLIYTAMAIPAGIATALGVAIILNTKMRALPLYRTLFFLPVLVPDVALAIVWLQMFNPQFGLINALIEQIGQLFGQQWLGPGWLASAAWAKPTLVLMNVWLIGQPMIIYLASLHDVPQDLLDAAAVDGATWLQQLRNVTIPMVTPVIFYQLVTGLIGSLQLFTQPWVITAGQGTPAQSMMFYAMQLYRQAFVYFNMGQAEAMAWALFVVVLVLSFLVFKSSARWVYYGGADEKR